jgi:hypothetical protein
MSQGQLSLFDPVAENGNDELWRAVADLVREDGMSDRELAAVVEDALARMGWHPDPEAGRPQPCRCAHRLVFRPGVFDDARCAYCGRVP